MIIIAIMFIVLLLPILADINDCKKQLQEIEAMISRIQRLLYYCYIVKLLSYY